MQYGTNQSFYISIHPIVGFHLRYGGFYENGNGFVSSTITKEFSPNSWHHLAATWKSNNTNTIITLYIDGVLVETKTVTLQLGLLNTTAYIGGNTDGFFGPGALDEIRIWNYAKTAIEINSSYKSPITTLQTGLVSYHNFNIGTANGNNLQHSILANVHNPTQIDTLQNFTLNGNSSNFINTVTPLSTNINVQDNMLHFDGVNDYITKQFSINTASGTWEAWVQKENWATTTDEVLFSNGLNFNADNSFYVSLHPIVGLHFRYGGQNQEKNIYINNINTKSFLPNSKHHITARYYRENSKTHLALFIDGALQAFGETELDLGVQNTPCYIGGTPSGNYFKGNIDEVRFWDIPRSATDIVSLNTTKTPLPQANLAGYLNFNVGIPSGNNVSLNTLADLINTNKIDVLNNFTLNGNTSNYVQSSETGMYKFKECADRTFTINGDGFEGALAANIKVGNIPVQNIISNTGKQLVVTLPNVAVSGIVSIQTANGTGYSSIPIEVLKPVLHINATKDSVCIGNLVTLTATGLHTYVWDNGITNATPFQINNTATYSVIGKDIYGCVDTASKLITALSLPLPNFNLNISDTAVCENKPITLNAYGNNLTYTWSNGIKNNVPFIPDNTTTYTVTGTNENGCNTIKSSRVVVNKILNSNIVASRTIACQGTRITLSHNSRDFALSSKSDFLAPISRESYAIVNIANLHPSNSILKKVYIRGFSLDFSGSLNIILESPSGQKFIILYGAGEGYFENADLTFVQDDDAPYYVITSDIKNPEGVFKPTNNYNGSHDKLYNFTGNLNGTWKLHVSDGVGNYLGSMNSFQLEFETNTSTLWTTNVSSEVSSIRNPNSPLTYVYPSNTATYYANLTSNVGCVKKDSIVIRSGTNNNLYQTAANSFTWNGYNYNSTGTYTHIYTNENGCFSVDTLHLTITAATVWNGTEWSNGLPNTTLHAIIASSIAPGSFQCKDLTINDSVTLNISNGSTVTVIGSTTNYGNIVVAPTGNFVSAAAVNNVTLQQSIIGQRGWRMFAYPFTTTATFSNLAATNGIAISITPSGASGLTDVRSFTNGTTNGWNNVTDSSTTANRPFALFIRGLASEVSGLNYTNGPSPFTFNVTGTLNASPFTVTPSASNFTLVGNPFAAPVNSSALTNGAGKSYYIYQINQGGSLTAQRTKAGAWTAVLSSSNTTPIPTLGVIAYQADSASNYNITTNDINTTNTATTGLFSTEEAVKHLELRVSHAGKIQDNWFLRQDDHCKPEASDSKDLLKLANEGLNLYSLTNNSARLAVDARNIRKQEAITIALGIAGAVGNYHFSVANMNIDKVKIWLKDAYAGTTTALTTNSQYQFSITTDANSKGENRFKLVMENEVTNVVSVDNINTASMTAKIINSNLQQSNEPIVIDVSNAKNKVFITVSDVTGKVLKTYTGQNGRNTIQLGSIVGVQLITITDGITIINQKVVKQ